MEGLDNSSLNQIPNVIGCNRDVVHDEEILKKVLLFFEQNKENIKAIAQFSVQNVYDLIQSKLISDPNYDVKNVFRDISIQDASVVVRKGLNEDNSLLLDIPEGSSNKNPGIFASGEIPGSSSPVSRNTRPYPDENTIVSNSSVSSIDSPVVDRVEDHISSDVLSNTGDGPSKLPIVNPPVSTSPVNPAGNPTEPPIAPMTSPALVPPSSSDLTEGNSENYDIIRLSKAFELETSLFLQYIAEIKVKDFTLNKKACIQGFISKLQGCHMELLYKVLETHSLVEKKNSEIIDLHKQLLTNVKPATSVPKKPVSNSTDTPQNSTDVDNNRSNSSLDIEISNPLENCEVDPILEDLNNGKWVKVDYSKHRRKPKGLSFSDIVKKPVKDLDKPKFSVGKTCSSPSTDSHILLLEPASKGGKMENTAFLDKRSKIKSLINSKNKGIKVDNINRTKTGGILMAFPSFKDLENSKLILDNASSDIELSTKSPNKVLPKIAISNIDSAVPSSQIVNVLLDKNPELKSEMNLSNSVFELVFSKIDTSSHCQTAIVKCSSNIRAHIMKSGFLFIDCDKCHCSDHLFVHQCSHCAAFGHSASRCTRKNRENRVCFNCADKGGHTAEFCSKPNVHACANCLSSNDPSIRDDAICHTSNSKTCPLYLRELYKLALRTDYGSDIVYY